MANKSKWFLKNVRIDSYGGFTNRVVGPFESGMNVVYGPNESGKTTLASFIGGVLFGWPDARSKKNVYKPVNAERSGSLVFENDQAEQSVLSRARNADGLQGDEKFVDDLDAETYESLFSLNSDELLQLNSASDMTSSLLTAGSGTAVSPSKALEDLDARVASFTSKSAAATNSLVNLTAKRDELTAELADQQRMLEACEAENNELGALYAEAADLKSELSSANKLADKLSSARATLLSNGEKEASLVQQKAQLNERATDAAEQRDLMQEGFAKNIGVESMDAVKERSVRATLEDLQVQHEHLESIAETARGEYHDSSSRYQVLAEAEASGEGFGRTPGRRTLMLGFSVVFPLAALAAGVYCVMKGAEITSLYLTFVGIALILCAVALAGGVAVIALRPNKKEHVQQRRLEEAKWIMLQDEKKMNACAKDVEEHCERIASFLSFNGLAAADGSIRRARELLDEMRDGRQQVELLDQRRADFVSQLSAVNREVQALRLRNAEQLKDCECASLEELEDRIEAVQTRREQANTRLQVVQKRIGELEQKLDSLHGNRDFDKMKLEVAQLNARLSRGKYDYARTLLARRRLASAMEVWESESQPAVYDQASRLFAKMTGNAWTSIRFAANDELYVVDPDGLERKAELLSTGTCQQLYLSLRLALLMKATNVGSRVPILADDILVHFDDERRARTAEALLELSQVRQVILLTCHEEIAKLLVQLDSEVNVVRLS